ncbi:hypothetical protein PR202_ga15856 [Eleusine coracana subsp. coracana]|uniref:60S ribosomal protein L34 n=1 Tax=Eleusine coracana subsp. coracana TaxID=191504 RepID=A0AAV5CK59_ELECO|nr:hypothetical protein PR202_ga15856 [Eleusine coracana subsp. coracana]
MVQRLTYRKRHSYATKSNQTRVVKTPGGRLVYQYTDKRASGPKCPVTGKKIQGVSGLCYSPPQACSVQKVQDAKLPIEKNILSLQFHVILLSCRIIRAFLVEEQKIVKKVLKIQKTKDKASSK